MAKLATRLGRAVCAARQSRRLTQAQLAEQLGMATEALGRLERGISLPRTSTLVELSRVLGVSIDDLLGVSSGTTTGALPLDLRRLVAAARRLPHRKRQSLVAFLEDLVVDMK